MNDLVPETPKPVGIASMTGFHGVESQTDDALKRTPFDLLDPLDQYMIAKSIYEHLDRLDLNSIRLAVFRPEHALPEKQKDTWLELYLCQAIVNAAEQLLDQIVAKAKTDAAIHIEKHAKLAVPHAKVLLKIMERDEEFRAALAMKGLNALPESPAKPRTA